MELQLHGKMLFRSAEVVDEMLCTKSSCFSEGSTSMNRRKSVLKLRPLPLGEHLYRPRFLVEERWDFVSHELKQLLPCSSDSRLEALSMVPSGEQNTLVESPIIEDNASYVNNQRLLELRIWEFWNWGLRILESQNSLIPESSNCIIPESSIPKSLN